MIIDICMPFWGDPQDMRSAVDSVLAQTDPRWRLTVIDDCYPDETVATYFAGLSDERVRYVRNQSNVGITENFRRAVAAAEGAYVVVFGSDDLLHPDYVALMRRTADAHPDADVVQLGVTVIGSGGERVRTLVDTVKQRLLAPRRPLTLEGESMARSLLVGDWLYWPSLMFRTEKLRSVGFRDDLPIILDLAVLVDIAFAGGSLRYDPQPAFSYRRHGESLSQKTIFDGSRFEDERNYYRETAARAAERGWKKADRAARWRIMSRLHGVAVMPSVIRSGSARARRAALALALGS